ncbi:MAG: acyltransferase [Hyphomicrobiales bacterium]
MNALSQTMPMGARHNPWLDLVRALAIVLVLLRHGEKGLADAGRVGSGVFHTIMMNGWIGVDLFFVLSGYLITAHLLRRPISSQGLRRYFEMRALRILPAYYAVLFLIVIGAFPFYAVDPAGLPVRVAYHLLLLQDYLPSNINVAFWSLGVEEKFYVIAPLLVAGLAACRRPRFALAAIATLLLISPLARSATFAGQQDWTYLSFFQQLRSPFHMSLEPLLLGVAIAYAGHMGLLRQLPRRPFAFVAVFVCLMAYLGSHEFMATLGTFDASLQPVLISLLCAALVLFAVGLDQEPMPLRSPAEPIARLSYCLYLVHFPLIPLALILAGASTWQFWLAYLSATVLVSVALHLCVERPFLRIKDRIALQRDRRKPRPATVMAAE